MNKATGSTPLPILRKLKLDHIMTLVLVTLMAIISVGSLLNSSTVYPTEALFQSFAINDVINIVIGVPILLVSMWLSRGGKLTGLLLWPGALLYVLYNYVVYVFGIPFTLLTLAYGVIVLLSSYIIFDLLRKIEMLEIRDQLAGKVPVRSAGGVLLLFGIAFIFRALSIIVDAITTRTALPLSEIGLLIADFMISTVWIGGGAALLRRKSIGYVGGLGLLFAGSMLFIGLILVLSISPLLIDAEFILTDVVVVSVMGLICFIPFGLYLRGVVSVDKAS